MPGDHASSEDAERHTIVETGFLLDSHSNVVKDADALRTAARAALEGGPLPCRSFGTFVEAALVPRGISLVESAGSRPVKHFVAVLLVAAAACSQATASDPTCTRGPLPAAHQWSVHLDDAPTAAAADAGGVVVTASGGTVWAFDRAGREVWRTHVAGAGLDWPVIDGDLVVVPVTTATGAACVALERASGAERWRADAGPGIVAATTAGGGRVVCASARGRLVAVERGVGRGAVVARHRGLFQCRTGRRLAPGRGRHRPHFPPAAAVCPHHAAGVVTVVIRVRGHWIFSCWDLATGAEARCGLDLGGVAPASAVAGAGNSVFVVGSGSSHEVALIDVDARQVRAAVATADAFDPANIPLVTGRIAVVVDRSGQVTAVDVATGRRRWRADLGTPILDAKPAAAAGVVRIVDWTGRVFALRLADGHRAAPVDDTRRRDRGGRRPGRQGGGHAAARRRRRAPRRPRSRPGALGGRGSRPLQCSVEPGQSPRNDARP